jgi:hypothetical protein
MFLDVESVAGGGANGEKSLVRVHAPLPLDLARVVLGLMQIFGSRLTKRPPILKCTLSRWQMVCGVGRRFRKSAAISGLKWFTQRGAAS